MITKVISSQKIEIKKSKIPQAQRGVFARKLIKRNELIEECPVLVVPRKDYLLLKKTILRNYYFMWGKVTCGICLGFGSTYNHSYAPNATFKINIKNHLIRFVAIKDIKKGEEITVNYNYGDPDNKKPLWIKDIKPWKG